MYSQCSRAISWYSRTNLNRRLHERGTTFHHKVSKVRYAMAQNFLTSNEASNAEIALALGHTDATTFNHAFMRWSGMSPAQWRERHA